MAAWKLEGEKQGLGQACQEGGHSLSSTVLCSSTFNISYY